MKTLRLLSADTNIWTGRSYPLDDIADPSWSGCNILTVEVLDEAGIRFVGTSRVRVLDATKVRVVQVGTVA